MPILEWIQVSKSFGGRTVLDACSFSLEKGKIIGLLGPNGQGKTTLVRLVSGLLAPDAGEILFDGKPLDLSCRERIAYLPDHDFLDRSLSARQAIDLMDAFFDSFDAGKAFAQLEIMHLDPDQTIRTMSKGMRQKLQLILVLSRQADLYILDEPLSGVDPAARDQILDTILRNYSENGTVLLASHLVSDIEPVLDQVLFLDHGKTEGPLDADVLRMQEKGSIDACFRRKFKCV